EEMGKYYQIATVLYEVLKMVVPPSKVETEEKGSSEIVFKAMGRAINKTVTIMELIGVKKSFKMRHQPCSVTSGTKYDGTVGYSNAGYSNVKPEEQGTQFPICWSRWLV
ncbi:ribonuclease P protein subunit p25-like protein isoform X2, partial [Tanacetum coccineum]